MASKTIENKLIQGAANAYLIKQITRIIENCEEIQKDDKESAYTKQQAKLSAYKEMVELLR